MELFDALRENAAVAEESYKDRPVELSGYLKNVDADRGYVFVGADPDNWTYSLDSVRCEATDGSLADLALGIGIGNRVMVRGRITDVGEVLGYIVEIDGIEAAGAE